MASSYVLGVYVERMDGSVVREIVNEDWRMSFMQADAEAARLNGRYEGRRYTAVNVNDIANWVTE